MALQKTIKITGDSFVVTEFGNISNDKADISIDAYIKVENIAGTKNNISTNISFTDNNKSFCKSYQFVPLLNGENFIKQAYLHLKTLPEFADAVDC